MKETTVQQETLDLAIKAGFKMDKPKEDKNKKLMQAMPMDEAPIQKPTQSLLQKWLKTQHNIAIGLFFNKYWSYKIFITKRGMTITGFSLNATQEDALENGLQMALRLIKL